MYWQLFHPFELHHCMLSKDRTSCEDDIAPASPEVDFGPHRRRLRPSAGTRACCTGQTRARKCVGERDRSTSRALHRPALVTRYPLSYSKWENDSGNWFWSHPPRGQLTAHCKLDSSVCAHTDHPSSVSPIPSGSSCVGNKPPPSGSSRIGKDCSLPDLVMFVILL